MYICSSSYNAKLKINQLIVDVQRGIHAYIVGLKV